MDKISKMYTRNSGLLTCETELTEVVSLVEAAVAFVVKPKTEGKKQQ